MNLSSFKGMVTKPSAYTACGQNIFEQTDATKLVSLPTSSDATDAWYKGKSMYDYVKGAPKAAKMEVKKPAGPTVPADKPETITKAPAPPAVEAAPAKATREATNKTNAANKI